MKVLDITKMVFVVQLSMVIEGNEQSISNQLRKFVGISPKLVLDMNDIDLNSMAIGALVSLLNLYKGQWNEDYEKIGMINISDRTRSIIDLSKLTPYFEMVDDLDDFYSNHC
ncbi:MAG: hypothetical protein HQK84_11890 [Nitrospinae bacterium]|nr:hypothetical protein [Nitrospinota bacterium]